MRNIFKHTITVVNFGEGLIVKLNVKTLHKFKMKPYSLSYVANKMYLFVTCHETKNIIIFSPRHCYFANSLGLDTVKSQLQQLLN